MLVRTIKPCTEGVTAERINVFCEHVPRGAFNRGSYTQPTTRVARAHAHTAWLSGLCPPPGLCPASLQTITHPA